MERASDLPWYHRNDDFVYRTIAGEAVLVPIRQQIGELDSIYTLNEAATCVWERLAEPASLAQLVDALDRQFEGDRDIIRRDTQEFLDNLLRLGAIRRVEPPGSTART